MNDSDKDRLIYNIIKGVIIYYIVLFAYFGIRVFCIVNHIHVLFLADRIEGFEDFVFRNSFGLFGAFLGCALVELILRFFRRKH